jgi:coiled-coil domain-containing protein 6
MIFLSSLTRSHHRSDRSNGIFNAAFSCCRQIEGKRNGDTAANLANNIHQLRQEVARLKQLLSVEELNHQKKMAEFSKEERHIREENLRLQRKLQLEMERREALCRHLSESESSLEMEEERLMFAGVPPLSTAVGRSRTVSSPIPPPSPYGAGGQQPPAPSPSPTLSRPLSPGLNYGEQRRESGGQRDFTPPARFPVMAGVSRSTLPPRAQDERHAAGFSRPEKFAKPAGPVTVSTSPGPPSLAISPYPSPGSLARVLEIPPASPMEADNDA